MFLREKEGDRSPLVILTLFSDAHYIVCENDVIENVTE